MPRTAALSSRFLRSTIWPISTATSPIRSSCSTSAANISSRWRLVEAFEKEHPDYKGRIYWETIPPGLLVKKIEAGGTITSGNMTWTATPDAYFAGLKKVDALIGQGLLTGPAVPYAIDTLTIMVPKGNPGHVTSLADLGKPDIRLAMPNPEFEGIARHRGSVLTPFHDGPVSPTKHHLTLSRAELLPDGSVRFHVYLDAGTPEAPVHVVAADLLDSNKHYVVHWNTALLSKLPKTAFANDYAYNKFGPGASGIQAKMGAAATLTLPVPASDTAAGARLRAVDRCRRQHFHRDPWAARRDARCAGSRGILRIASTAIRPSNSRGSLLPLPKRQRVCRAAHSANVTSFHA
jgi:Bacterial extracellular solute-binding protein/TQO small subunit DoxA